MVADTPSRFGPQPHRVRNPHRDVMAALPRQDRIALAITGAIGTMYAVYAFATFMAGWILLQVVLGNAAFDPYPFAFLLFLGNIVQLLLMFVIMVGQQVLGSASDKRAVVTYQDAEAILHECLQMQDHLTAQDGALERIIHRMEQLEARMGKAAG